MMSDDLREALKRMVDEAEHTLKNYKEEMDAWSYAEYDGHKYSFDELAPELVAAIAAARKLLDGQNK